MTNRSLAENGSAAFCKVASTGAGGKPRWASLFPRVFPYESVSWRQTIARSGLPDEVQQLILEVIRKSRLLRFEKVEVVQELISHFTDGQLAGYSGRQLIEKFGDPLVTAKLIRRSKIRNRPIMFKTFQILGWCMLALTAVYMSYAGYFYSGVPTPNTDYLADLNLDMSETRDDDKAWPIYRPLWIKYGFSEGGGFSKESRVLFSTITNEFGENHMGELVKPGDPEWPAAIAKLEEWSDLLEAFREGAKKPGLGLLLQSDRWNYSEEDRQALFPISNPAENESKSLLTDRDVADKELQQLLDGSILSILLPHIQSFRNAARMFHVDTRWAIEQNDSQRALSNIETVMGLARQATDCNTLVGSLVGIAVQGIAIVMLEETLVASPDFFDDQQLERLQRRVEAINFVDWINFDGERAMFYDVVQRVFTDDGNGEGRITPLGIRFLESGLMGNSRFFDLGDVQEYQGLVDAAEFAVAPASLFMVASRSDTIKDYDHWTDRIEAEMAVPFWQANDFDEEFEKFLVDSNLRLPVLNQMIPAYSNIRFAKDRMMGQQEAVIAALVMHRYFLKYKEWPTSFDQLSPEFVSEFPVDIINGDFIKFRIGDRGPVIYSIGNDRDDDGGKPITIENHHGEVRLDHFRPGKKNEQTPDGDSILWPSSLAPQ